MKRKIKTYLAKNKIASMLQIQQHIDYLRYKKDRTVEETQAFFDLVGVVCNHKSDLDWYFMTVNDLSGDERFNSFSREIENLIKNEEETKPVQVFYYNKKDEDFKRLQEIMDDEHRPTNWEVLQKYIGKSKKDKPLQEKDMMSRTVHENSNLSEQEKLRASINLIRNKIPLPSKEDMEYLGEKRRQGIKETEGKLDHSEINLSILDLMAERFMANKHKYPLGNSKKEIDTQSLVQAMFRHIVKMIKPPVNDPETFKDHLAAVLCGASMVLDQLERQDKL